MTQKHYGTFSRKTPDATVTNGSLYRARAEKSLASNATADTNSLKKDLYYATDLNTAT